MGPGSAGRVRLPLLFLTRQRAGVKPGSRPASWDGLQEPEDSQTRRWAGPGERCLFVLLSSPLELPPRGGSVFGWSPQLPAGGAQRTAVGMNEGMNEVARPLALTLPGSRPASRGTSTLLPWLSQVDPGSACLYLSLFPAGLWPGPSGPPPCQPGSGSTRLSGKELELTWSWCSLLLMDKKTEAQGEGAVGQGWGYSPCWAAPQAMSGLAVYL